MTERTKTRRAIAQERMGRFAAAITRLNQTAAGLGLAQRRPMTVLLDEADGAKLEIMAIEYTGTSAHTLPDGSPIPPVADGQVRRFRLGPLMFQYVRRLPPE